jgi:ubiquinone/menaquinone biosynthesis C-methylase UbiE
MATQFKVSWSWYEKHVHPITSLCYEAFEPYLQFKDEPLTILDAGCGLGVGLPIIQKWFHSDSRLVGVDIDPKALAVAASLNLPNTSVVLGNLQQLEMPDSHFDRYISCSILSWVADPSRVIAEAFRVVKPGGVAGFCVFAPRERCQWMNMQSTFRERAIMEDQGLKSSNANAFQCSSEEILRSLTSQAGFEFVHCFEQQLVIRTPDYEAGTFENPSLSKFFENPRNVEIMNELFAELRQKSEPPSVGFIFITLKKPS